ncbi:DUF4307 domain-containing protein [Klugiella xanthotipulae]|uniref:DUF4307 domain-containing protein n=1 Tax=Klugiella xanthotipulae TaxID=244735 RepID=UPI001476BE67|nr:DUF4307 domain-containing protein [Klugiella xanthotipulae]
MREQHLEDRYGRSASRRLDKRLLGVFGGALGLLLVAWVIWATLSGNSATLEYRNLGYDTISDHSVEVLYEVTAPAGSSVACVVQALSESYAVVGYRVVVLPESDQRTRSFTESLRTVAPSNTGVVDRCWILS